MWCKCGHVTVEISTQRDPRAPPCGHFQFPMDEEHLNYSLKLFIILLNRWITRWDEILPLAPAASDPPYDVFVEGV